MLYELRIVLGIATMARSRQKQPLIAIIGATGTGKSQVGSLSTNDLSTATSDADHNSQLAVELAKRYNGEVINGDAMQLYTGLPIITNKITTEEQQGIPHHLLGCIGLDEQTWVVGTFVKKALRVVEGIRSRGKVPILVGGTHYYLQSLLFRDGLAEHDETHEEKSFVKDTKEEWPILQQDTESLLAELRRVDPIMADRWHPNDRRKIQRSLEIYLQTGKKASDIYAEQRQQTIEHRSVAETDSGIPDEPSLRFPTLLFWVHAESDALKERLDKRADKMMHCGLLDEVKTLDSFADAEAAGDRPVDESRGVWVSIGYKEFKAYTKAVSSLDVSAKEIERLKAEALERTKISTRQYAKRQVRWIRIKLINALAQAHADKQLYLLDGSDVSSFDTSVVQPAAELTEKFLAASSPLPEPSATSAAAAEMLMPRRDYDLSAHPGRWVKEHCEVCGVTCVTEDQWKMHVKSKAHRKLVSKMGKAEGERKTEEVAGG